MSLGQKKSVCHLLLMSFIIVNVRASVYSISPNVFVSNKCSAGFSCFALSQVLMDISVGSIGLSVSLILQPGDHSLIVNHTLSELKYLSMKSEDIYQSQTFISCERSSRLNFRSITHLHIQGITFNGCSGNEVNRVNKLIIEDSMLLAGRTNGPALMIVRSAVILLKSQFIGFKNLGNLTTKSVAKGGAIYCFESYLLVARSIFSENSAVKGHGGAIYCADSTVLIIKCKFAKNTATDGGALYSDRTKRNINNTVLSYFQVYMTLWAKYHTENTTIFERDSIHCIGSNFTNNSASSFGGAINSQQKSILYISECMFVFNGAKHGGVLYILQSKLSIIKSIFQMNEASTVGGVASCHKSIIVIKQSWFCKNKAGNNAGTFYFAKTNVHINSGNFYDNKAVNISGGLSLTLRSNILLTGKNYFMRNSALYGAVINIYHSVMTCNGYVYVRRNNGSIATAHSTIIIDVTGIIIYTNNNASIYFFDSKVVINGSLNFTKQTQVKKLEKDYTLEGGGLTLFISEMTINGTVTLKSNSATNGGGLLSIASRITVSLNGKLLLINNTALDTGGGMYLVHSEVYTQGPVLLQSNNANQCGGGIHSISSIIVIIHSRHTKLNFNKNVAKSGGGICLEAGAKIYIGSIKKLAPFKYVKFIDNTADRGGAIYVADNTTSATCASTGLQSVTAASQSECFIQMLRGLQDSDSSQYIIGNYFSFEKNSARFGAILYGGLLDRCTVNAFDRNIPYSSIPKSTEAIVNDTTSDPVRACLCEPDTDLLMCNKVLNVTIMKGGNFTLKVAAIDQVNKTVSAVIHSSLASQRGYLGDRQQAQRINAACADLKFSIFTPVESEDQLSLYAEGPCTNLGISSLKVKIEFISCQCSIGFEPILKKKDRCVCGCHHILKEIFPFIKDSDCNSDTQTLTRTKDFWISITNVLINTTTFISHEQCPDDYCHPSSPPVHINFSSIDGPDMQCAFNHTGILCGRCKPNLSLSLGSSRCIECPRPWPAICAVMLVTTFIGGLALITLILVLNVTVAKGTLNAIIFYANVLYANNQLYMPLKGPNIFSILIAWLNLDVGFDVCFFRGLNAYGKVWFQLIFPVYIILIVIAVIVTSHYSRRFASVIGHKNPIATLATLILLSYAKLLQSTIGILSFSILHYTPLNDKNSFTRVVWLKDGSVEYLKGIHVPLFIAAALILLLGFFYTLLLLSWQWLVKFSNTTVFCWLRSTKLSSFIDAYHAPYIPRNRYWTGLLLLARFILYLTAAANISGEPRINLLTLLLVIGSILLLHGLSGVSIYKTWTLNVVEFTTYFNILSLTAVEFYNIQHVDSTHKAAAYMSISIQMILFISLLVHHVVTEFGLVKKIKHCYQILQNSLQSRQVLHSYHQVHSNASRRKVTFSEVTLK